MKWVWYGIAVLAAILIPTQRTDIGKLKPMGIMMVTATDGVTIVTDTGDWGSGENLKEAMEDLKQKSTGIVYFDTVEYVLRNEEARVLEAELMRHLRKGVRIYGYSGMIDLKEAAAYLDVHAPRSGGGGVLQEKNGRYVLTK